MKENNKEIIGGIYTGVSERFQRGVLKDMSRSLKANIHDSGVVERVVFEERTDEGVRTFKDNMCGTIRTIDSGGDKRVVEIRQIGNITPNPKRENPQTYRVYDKEGLSPTLSCMEGGNLQPMIVDEPKVVQAVGDRGNHSYSIKDNTLTTVQKDNLVLEPQYRIRKLTPLECWRLMGFSDEDFHKAEKINSNSQLYKQAGNSIVVSVLEGIFENLL